MKKLFPLLFIVVIIAYCSCNHIEPKRNSEENKDAEYNQRPDDSVSTNAFTPDRKTLTKDFISWYSYTVYNVRLSQDFIGLDIDSIKIGKATFLNKLMTQNVVPFKTKVLQGEPVYKLFKLDSGDKNIRTTIKQMASTEMKYYQMEGIEIPGFKFTDLNGNIYDKSSTKGKIIVLKCWFIHCLACVKEFPELNKLVDENKKRDDILFISLATDDRQDLIKFLKTKEFKYAVVPGMNNYIVDKLNINEYPTHLLIDRNGKIIKVVNEINDLKPFLKKEINRNSL